MEFKDIEGKTIKSATQSKLRMGDDTGWLVLEFTDGTQCAIEAYYSAEYTGDSDGEHPTRIRIDARVDHLIPVNED
jgi:hypothetical protein